MLRNTLVLPETAAEELTPRRDSRRAALPFELRHRAPPWMVGLALAFLAACDGTPHREAEPHVSFDQGGTRCGNGVCSGKETCSTCPADCGSCIEPDPGVPAPDAGLGSPDAGVANPDAASSEPDSATPPDSGAAVPDAALPADSSSTPPDTTTTTPPPIGTTGIWISAAELASRPMSGPAWVDLKKWADASLPPPELYNQDSKHPVQTLAVALVYARTAASSYRKKALDAVMSIIVSGPVTSATQDGRSLALGRNLAAYVIAADLIDLPQLDAAQDATFRSFLKAVRFWTNKEGRSLVQCHEIRPNNWGTMCGASRIAADLYLGDQVDLDRAAKVLKGFLGDRTAYAQFKFGTDAFSWMCDPQQPRPINPAGCTKDGHDLSGAPVDDVRRGGTYQWPPQATHYAWGGFSAAAVQAELLHRAGYDAYNWENKAVLRGMTFIATAMPSSSSNATDWLPWLVNYRYKTSFPTQTPIAWGRLMSWTDWTHP